MKKINFIITLLIVFLTGLANPALTDSTGEYSYQTGSVFTYKVTTLREDGEIETTRLHNVLLTEGDVFDVKIIEIGVIEAHYRGNHITIQMSVRNSNSPSSNRTTTGETFFLAQNRSFREEYSETYPNDAVTIEDNFIHYTMHYYNIDTGILEKYYSVTESINRTLLIERIASTVSFSFISVGLSFLILLGAIKILRRQK